MPCRRDTRFNILYQYAHFVSIFCINIACLAVAVCIVSIRNELDAQRVRNEHFNNIKMLNRGKAPKNVSPPIG